MHVIATMTADLETTPLGTQSRLANELHGIPVLRRTVERVARAKRVDVIFVICPEAQYDRCCALIAGTGATVCKQVGPSPAWSKLVQAGRKWSLDGWRGGIGGTTHFDEYVCCSLISGLLRAENADAVLAVSPAAPLFDPGFADRMIEHLEHIREDTRIVFAQTPPGISGVVLTAPLVKELADQNIPIGWVLNYKPDTPIKDLIFEQCCFEVPTAVRHASGRLVADTVRSFETLVDLLRDHPDPDMVTVGEWLIDRDACYVQPFPREVEIELTTDDPYPDAVLRPRGPRVPARGSIDPEVVRRIAREVGRHDDSLIVLGGFGDPLRHPQFPAVLEALRDGIDGGNRLYGLALRTTGVGLNDETIDAILAGGVDIISVTLDAWSADLYSRLQSPGDPSSADLEAVLRRVDNLNSQSRERGMVTPLFVPEMTKARQNVHELDAFYDGWTRRNGAVCVTGYSHRAKQVEDHSVMRMSPPGRFRCRRLRSRCMVLADGRVTLCDQDLKGRYALGSINEQSLSELWTSAELQRIQSAHSRRVFDLPPLCLACDEWHRP